MPPANNRLRRAQQLRSKKGGAMNNKSTSGDEDDDALVLTGSCTFLIALAIIGVGAGLAFLFFHIHQPDCMKGISFGGGVASPMSVPETTTTQTAKLRRRLVEIGLEGNDKEEETAENEGLVLLP